MIAQAWSQVQWEVSTGGRRRRKPRHVWTKRMNSVAFRVLLEAQDRPDAVSELMFRSFYMRTLQDLDEAAFNRGCALVLVAMSERPVQPASPQPLGLTKSYREDFGEIPELGGQAQSRPRLH